MCTCDRGNNSGKASVRVRHPLTNEKVERVEAGIRTPAGRTDRFFPKCKVRRPPAPSENQRTVRATAAGGDPAQRLEFHPQRFIPLASAVLG